MKTKQWNDFKLWQKIAIIKLALVQIGLFISAWRDLSGRPTEKINGSKPMWRAALFLNFIGPLAYFVRGRKQSNWTEADVPDMAGKVAIVTGANSGIGYETARVLTERGATVIMACRNLTKAYQATEEIRALLPRGELVVMQLDLADLDSIRQFAASFHAQYDQLDLLINNAGIMVPPFGTTTQGFESQFGVNHLGHFLLTALLIDRLNQTPAARVVTVSSIAHRFGKIDFTDLNWQHKEYKPMPAYGQSKLANLLFTYELQRRLTAAGHETIAVAAHPGYTATNLQGDTATMNLMNRLFAQAQPKGALPTLYAATAPAVQGGQYFGPSGLAEIGGNPERVESTVQSHNEDDAQRLWTVSEQLTGISFVGLPQSEKENDNDYKTESRYRKSIFTQ